MNFEKYQLRNNFLFRNAFGVTDVVALKIPPGAIFGSSIRSKILNNSPLKIELLRRHCHHALLIEFRGVPVS
jgi:hypothetical protein